jgi:glycerol-3-phosphate dehydrogenase subunit B
MAVSEPLVPPPHAIHGLRMQKALDRALATSRVRLVPARVTGAEIAGRRIVALEGEGDAGPVKIRAERFVLATGRFAGGGLVGRGTVREAIFGLPVFHRARPVGDRAVFSLLRPGYFTRQPVFDAGIRVDADLRPLDADGGAAYENLLAAGTILGGYDLALDGTGPGVNLLTGFAAGEHAASA